MAFKIEFPNLALYMAKLGKLNAKKTDFVIKRSLYEGAKVLAEETQKEISGLKKELNALQRQGLHEGLGIAHMWKDGGMTVTKIGFEGYNGIRTKRWPKGQPNAMVARSIQRGTSWMMPNRFASRAARKAKARAIKAMQMEIDDSIMAIMKED